jgi:hypothetical protein
MKLTLNCAPLPASLGIELNAVKGAGSGGAIERVDADQPQDVDWAVTEPLLPPRLRRSFWLYGTADFCGCERVPRLRRQVLICR